MTDPADERAPNNRKVLAHALPMIVFILFIGLSSALRQASGPLWQTAPELWVYPLQTLLCAALLIFFRREYRFHQLRRPLFVLALALFVFFLWIAPQQFFHFTARRDGFNPDKLVAEPTLYWATLSARFLRLVIVAPLVEEIFWRAFLLRYLIAEKFERVPCGAFSWFSFGVVTIAFTLSHSTADWPAALVTGALYNLVAYRTKSLMSCVLTHALTNLALGLWIVATRQWGFW